MRCRCASGKMCGASDLLDVHYGRFAADDDLAGMLIGDDGFDHGAVLLLVHFFHIHAHLVIRVDIHRAHEGHALPEIDGAFAGEQGPENFGEHAAAEETVHDGAAEHGFCGVIRVEMHGVFIAGNGGELLDIVLCEAEAVCVGGALFDGHVLAYGFVRR